MEEKETTSSLVGHLFRDSDYFVPKGEFSCLDCI